jgi:hypothetical protein
VRRPNGNVIGYTPWIDCTYCLGVGEVVR